MSERIVEWTRAVALWWGYYNVEYVDAALTEPSFRLVDGMADLGRWDRERREIRISLQHLRADPWHEVMATLRHEMAHQYADEYYGAAGQSPHGPAFRRACRLLRVDPHASARGPDAAAAAADDEAARLTRLVSKLLALGTSPNQNEAAAAMRKARQLMLEHNLDVVAHDRARGFALRSLGPVRARHERWEGTLGAVLAEFFFVRVIWSTDYDAAAMKSGTSLFVHGTPPNLDMAEYVYGFLVQLLPRLWDEHRRTKGLRSNRDRRQFYDGVLLGFWQKLNDQKRELAAQSSALVWSGDPRLDEFYHWLNPRTRAARRGSRAVGDAWFAGKEVGRHVTIAQPLGGAAADGGGYLTG